MKVISMLTTIALVWSLAVTCPAVEAKRKQGYSDREIEQMARAVHVPEWIIEYAKKKCAR